MVLTLLPHLYALFLVLMHPFEIRGLRKKLDSIPGEVKPSDDWVEKAIFEDTMGNFYKAPLVAIIPTVVKALEKNKTELAGISLLIFVALTLSFSIIKSNWGPWDLNRGRNFLWWEFEGWHIIFIAKLAIVVFSGIIILAVGK